MSKGHKSGHEQLPTLKKIRYDWDLRSLFYKSENDPEIERDLTEAERMFLAFARKYKPKEFTATSTDLKRALTDYEKLLSSPAGRKPLRYFAFRQVLDSKDSAAEKKGNLIDNRMTKVANELLFFEIRLGKISKVKRKEYLADPSLQHFHYYLRRVFLEADHVLSEPEERILSLKSAPSSGMWIAGTEKIISNRNITFEKKTLSLPEAIEIIDSLPPKKKPKIWNSILNELETIAEVAENEFNAIITNKKISDELRGYAKPYSATVQNYENNEKSVEALVEAISTDGFKLSSRFYKLKAKLHGLKKIPYINKYDPLGKDIAIPFLDAVDICREAFYSIRHEYGAFFDEMLEGGRIDVRSKKGKRGGAFMSSDIGLPTVVFLNHTDTFKSLETLAHEMGHAIHSSRSKTQSPLYESYSTTTAETASTLFENIVFNKILREAPAKEKKILLHDRITRDISTIQRQIAFFNYELELHTRIREEGALTKEELTKMMTKHLRSYLGPYVDVSERDGLTFIYVPHLRYGFYVYTYTYGILMSNIMAARLEEDRSYASQIDSFLCAGGSDTVENIFNSIGIKADRTETFRESLSKLERDIEELEWLA